MLYPIFESRARVRGVLALRRGRNGYDVALCGPILIRHSCDGDQAALERLATLDRRRRNPLFRGGAKR
jgi:hypothetical protein